MSGEVWVSDVASDYRLGYKLGLRWKHIGKDWSPAQHIIEPEFESDIDQVNRSANGYIVERQFFPEAMAVWNRGCFSKVGDLFWAAGFMAVKGKLAEVLSRFDFGEGGLVPLPIYQEDMVTPEPGEFYILSFGARKNSLVADKSTNLRALFENDEGLQIWKTSSVNDNDVVLDYSATSGPDIWIEERVSMAIFMSDPLIQAIKEAGVKTDFRLRECRIAREK